jgi:microcystin-dependent protein
MSNPYVGEIRMFGGNFAPIGWAFCNGQLLPISEFETLFNLIGTTYGGDGQSTFAVPDLRGRAMIHQGTGPGLSTYVIGQAAGVEQVTLTTNQIPAHTHVPLGVTGGGNSPSPQNGYRRSRHVAQRGPARRRQPAA